MIQKVEVWHEMVCKDRPVQFLLIWVMAALRLQPLVRCGLLLYLASYILLVSQAFPALLFFFFVKSTFLVTLQH